MPKHRVLALVFVRISAPRSIFGHHIGRVVGPFSLFANVVLFALARAIPSNSMPEVSQFPLTLFGDDSLVLLPRPDELQVGAVAVGVGSE